MEKHHNLVCLYIEGSTNHVSEALITTFVRVYLCIKNILVLIDEVHLVNVLNLIGMGCSPRCIQDRQGNEGNCYRNFYISLVIYRAFLTKNLALLRQKGSV